MLANNSPIAPLALDYPRPVAAAGGIHIPGFSRSLNIECHVTTDDLKAHLLLLAVFHNIHHTVQPGGVALDDSTLLPLTTPAQFLSLARAQHRFDMWISLVLRRPGRDAAGPLQPHEIPPVDVLMLFHAYMLSPWNFYEDCYRSYPELEALGPFPFIHIQRLIDMQKLQIIPTTEQTRLWESCTGTQFSMPLHTDTDTVSVNCPRCIRTLIVPWVNNVNTGFGQQGFTATCAHCAMALTRESLSVARFLGDLVPSKSILAHTLLSATGEVDRPAAQAITKIIREGLGNSKPNGDQFGWKLSNIYETLKSNIGGGEEWARRLNHIMTAYAHPSSTSIHLGDAVLRQSRFINEMHRIGWSGHTSFEGQDTFLPNAIVRYHDFLALNPVSLVASLDIDLVFHTHQLQGSAFREMSFKVFGRFLNHDDSFENYEIMKSLNYTEEVWEKTYGSAYLLPEPKPIMRGNTPPPTCSRGCHGSIAGTIPGFPGPAEAADCRRFPI